MSRLKVLMLGWEFPPHKSGGLGTACHSLTKGLTQNGIEVTFVMPTAPQQHEDFVKIIGLKVRKTISPLTPYLTPKQYEQKYASIYSKDIFHEIKNYTDFVIETAKQEKHDVIHAHDWMTYKAGIEASKISNKPLIIHLHSTENDRTAGKPDKKIMQIEKEGLKAADRIITNSNYSKRNIIKQYKIKPEKIEVVHWGIEPINLPKKLPKDGNVVLFLGRVTKQKGTDYLIESAKQVIERLPNTVFIIAGDGDLIPEITRQARELGILDKMSFVGAVKEDEIAKLFQLSDICVMPSRSEPFGLVALESMIHGTPVLVSKNSGAKESAKNITIINPSNTKEMAHKIVHLLQNKQLREEIRQEAYKEALQLGIDKPANKTIKIYEKAGAKFTVYPKMEKMKTEKQTAKTGPVFFLDGRKIQTLPEMADELENISDEQFKEHTSTEKHIADWLEHFDGNLAQDVRKTTNKIDAQRTILKHLVRETFKAVRK